MSQDLESLSMIVKRKNQQPACPRQAESQVKSLGHKTSKKAICIHGRERINNQLVRIWKGRNNVKFYFPLWTSLRRQSIYKILKMIRV